MERKAIPPTPLTPFPYESFTPALITQPPTQSQGCSEEMKKEDLMINIKVLSPDGGEIWFKLKKNTSLGKLMSAYCERQSISSNSIRFLFDGRRVNDKDTAETLGLEDNDVIDCVIQQVVHIFFFLLRVDGSFRAVFSRNCYAWVVSF